jgi:hypothetical protein
MLHFTTVTIKTYKTCLDSFYLEYMVEFEHIYFIYYYNSLSLYTLKKTMKRGPKPRQVTQKLLEQIEYHAARGLSQKQICDVLGFSETWWHAKKVEYSFENAMSGNPVSQIFFLKNRDPNRWKDVKSINHLQLNVSKMTDTELLQELKSDQVLSSTFQKLSHS